MTLVHVYMYDKLQWNIMKGQGTDNKINMFAIMRFCHIKVLFHKFYNNITWAWTSLLPNGCPLARGAHNLPSGDQNFKQGAQTGA